jgi:hypothetical protein
MNVGSIRKLVAATLIAMCWLAMSNPVMAAQREVPPRHPVAAAELKPGLKADDGPLRPYGTDRAERLRRGRIDENILVVTVGAAGVYIVLALP